MDTVLKNEISEAILRYAVNENHKREMSAIPSDDDLAEIYILSKCHAERMKSLFAKESRDEIRSRIFNISRRIAIILVVVTSILFGALLTNQQVRAAIGQIIIEWYEQFTRFSFSGETTSEELSEWYPSYVPDGFEKTGNYSIADIVTMEYKSLENELISIDYSLSDGISFAVDNEHSQYNVIVRGGLEYHVFQAISNEQRTNIVWSDSGYSFFLSSNFDVGELMKVAESITMKK